MATGLTLPTNQMHRLQTARQTMRLSLNTLFLNREHRAHPAPVWEQHNALLSLFGYAVDQRSLNSVTPASYRKASSFHTH